MVAFGKVFPTKDGDTLHTVVIGGSDFARVCFDDVSDGCEELPLPLSPNDELTTMISVSGSFVLCPKKDIVLDNTADPASTHIRPTTLTPQIKEAPCFQADPHVETEDMISTPPTTVAAKTRALVGMQTPTSKIGLLAVEAKGTHTPASVTEDKNTEDTTPPPV